MNTIRRLLRALRISGKDSVQEDYERRRKALRERKASRSEFEDLQSEYDFHWADLYAQKEAVYTRKLVSRAWKLRVPIPEKHGPGGDFWASSPDWGNEYLTQKGIAVIRENIRTEEKWLREGQRIWIQVLGSAAGLVGAITGLVAVFMALG